MRELIGFILNSEVSMKNNAGFTEEQKRSKELARVWRMNRWRCCPPFTQLIDPDYLDGSLWQKYEMPSADRLSDDCKTS